MKKSTGRLSDLIQRYFDGTITKIEETELWFYVDDEMFSDKIENLLPAAFDPNNELPLSGLGEQQKKAILFKIFGQETDERRTIWLWPRRIAAAALILILLSASYYILFQSRHDQQMVATRVKNDILPGGNKALLILSNGKRIVLDSIAKGKIAVQQGIRINKDSSGIISYGNKNETADVDEGKIAYNTIATPRGGQYWVTLSDGSRILLNAASSLRFPARFSGSERRVTLSGEAYFAVAKDRQHPFIISTNKQNVRVLGTHFIVNSYTDEPVVKTTLIEGSVRVTVAGSQQSALLKPGEQAILNNKDVYIKPVDTSDVLAWKNGYFMFDSEGIQSIMRKVARWYAIDVIYEGPLPQDTFYATVSRFSSVSHVLEKLELTGKVHFKIGERRIIVSK